LQPNLFFITVIRSLSLLNPLTTVLAETFKKHKTIQKQ